MTLREYLFYNRLQQKDLAVLLDCSPQYLQCIVNDKTKPSPKLSRKIKEITGIDVEPSPKFLHKHEKKKQEIIVNESE